MFKRYYRITTFTTLQWIVKLWGLEDKFIFCKDIRWAACVNCFHLGDLSRIFIFLNGYYIYLGVKCEGCFETETMISVKVEAKQGVIFEKSDL